jgi:acyl-CoA reductase-like NAD-dependent aldehyde dehydrogenase
MTTTKLWINDSWIDASGTFSLDNPHTGERLAEIGYASVEQAEMAIHAAHEAYQSFRTVAAHERGDILYRVADIIERRKEEAAQIIAKEAAKPIRAARGEIARTITTYRFAAEAAKDIRGETIPMDAAPRGENHVAYVQWKSLGVVTAITPFNFPFNLVAHKVGPAIAAGNTIVLKPAEKTPLSALFLAEVFQEAGLPKGVLNIIPGDGKELSEILTTHPKVAFITFTGSPRVGRIIRQQAGFRKVTLELGSNSPLIVDEGMSEADLDKISGETIAGAFSYNGQVCISIQRVYVHQSAYESFVGKLTTAAEALKIGDPLAEDTDISALINGDSAERLKAWLDNAVSRGATVRTGGKFDGNIMYPTILTDVSEDVELSCEEAFGPVVIVQPFETFTGAVEAANRSKFGLNAGVFTKSIERALYAADAVESGGVLINETPTFRVDQMPYGGVKESGVGREGVRYAMFDMMEEKFVSIRLGVFQD